MLLEATLDQDRIRFRSVCPIGHNAHYTALPSHHATVGSGCIAGLLEADFRVGPVGGEILIEARLSPAQRMIQQVEALNLYPARVSVHAEEDRDVAVQRLYVPEIERGTGSASAAMTAICRIADRLGVTLHLEALPDEDEPDMDQARLVQFYQRFGFTGNAMMYREPQRRGLSEAADPYVYHATIPRYLAGIVRHGLVPGGSERSNFGLSDGDSIYFGKTPADAMYYGNIIRKNEVEQLNRSLYPFVALLRVPRSALGPARDRIARKSSDETLDRNEVTTQRRIGVNLIDILIHGKWIKLARAGAALEAIIDGDWDEDINESLNESTNPLAALRALGGHSDIPNDTWLRSKQGYADEDYEEARNRGRTTGFNANRLNGKVTADIYVWLPTSAISDLPGLSGEHEPGPEQRGRGVKARLLAPSMKNGYNYDKGNSIFVVVNHRGEAFIAEGNNRTALAAQNGIARLPVNVRYFNGGELADGPMSPVRLLALKPERIIEGLTEANNFLYPYPQTPEWKREVPLPKWAAGDLFHGTARSKLTFKPKRVAYFTTGRDEAADIARNDVLDEGDVPAVIQARIRPRKVIALYFMLMQDLHAFEYEGLVRELLKQGFDAAVGLDIKGKRIVMVPGEICVINPKAIDIISTERIELPEENV